MPVETFNLKSLAHFLGRDARDLEKLASQGRIPGHRINGNWRFHRAEVHHWLEQEMPHFSLEQLEKFEETVRDVPDEFESPLTIRPLMHEETTAVPIEGRTAQGVLRSLVATANRTWQLYDPARILEVVREREALQSTAMPGGVAIPHPGRRLPNDLGESLIAYGRTSSPIPFGGSHGQMTDIFFLILCREDRLHLQVLARLARLIQQPGFLDHLRACHTSRETLDAIEHAEEAVA